MKKTIIVIISFILVTSCKSDNFYNTQRIIKTDKTEYFLEEDIKLTLKIIPEGGKKEIRLYENYQNLEISFDLINGERISEWSKDTREFLPETNIKTLIISKQKPFEKTFIGKITAKQDSVEVHFPELKTKVIFSKEKLKTDTVRIHGFCNPIKPEFAASLEDYFEVKYISIKVE